MILNLNIFSFVFFLLTANSVLSQSKSCGENPGNNLIVLIAEKISLEEDTSGASFDAKFNARYKILEILCGQYTGDTIEFVVYDHYGTPAFSEYKNVMLYISRDDSGYYHQKYLYHDVYRTKNGRWASPYSSRDYRRIDTHGWIKPIIIDFVDEVSFNIENRKRQWVKRVYPSSYFTILPGKAVAMYGNYAPELFELTKATVLTSRGIFGEMSKEGNSIKEIDSIILGSFDTTITPADLAELKSVWKNCITSIKTNNLLLLKQYAEDTVVCSICEGFSEPDYYNDMELPDSLLSSAVKNLPGTKLWDLMQNEVDFKAFYYDTVSLYSQETLPSKERSIEYAVAFTIEERYDQTICDISHSFVFNKYGTQFKFAGVKSSSAGCRYLNNK